MSDVNIYKSYTDHHELDVVVDFDGVIIYDAEVGAMNYAAVASLTRDEAIAAAKAILAYHGEGEE